MGHLELFYVDPKDVKDNEVIIKGVEFIHLTRVLRKQKGDWAWATDGLGGQYEFQITGVEKDHAIGRILKTKRMSREPAVELTLAQAILKGERFEFVIEKGTEIGVRRFIPLITKRGIATQTPPKRTRWQRIALAAMKQSGRSILPEVTQAMDVREALCFLEKAELKLIAHEKGGKNLRDMVASERRITSVALLIGPEGGFTQKEVQHAQEAGFQTLSLGPRRLRSETAGIVAVTLVLGILGELGSKSHIS